MTKEEFEEKCPVILRWIRQTLAEHASQACPIASLGFKRLPQYFSPEILSFAKVIYVSKVPRPPLNEMGLSQFADFEKINADGITYLDAFFLSNEMRGNEALHFHELIHIIQWKLLGPERFIAVCADGLERIGYRQSPIEVLAYTLESVFRNSLTPFDVTKVVSEQLDALYS